MMNQMTVIGHVGADPKITQTRLGHDMASFRIATTEKWNDKATGDTKEKTQWHSVVVFNEHLVKVVREYVKKGSRLFVQGPLEYREWHKEGTPKDDKRWQADIVLQGFNSTLKLLDRAPSNRPPEHDGSGVRDYQRPPNGNGNGASHPADHGDEIPF